MLHGLSQDKAQSFSLCTQVGWFLHTPFPSSEIYRTLPVREEVLRAVLKADLIGFHTYDYARHFVSACTRILGLEVHFIFPGLACCLPCQQLAAKPNSAVSHSADNNMQVSICLKPIACLPHHELVMEDGACCIS